MNHEQKILADPRINLCHMGDGDYRWTFTCENLNEAREMGDELPFGTIVMIQHIDRVQSTGYTEVYGRIEKLVMEDED